MADTNELITAPIDLTLSGEPQDILDAARRAAKALQTVIANKPQPVIFNNQQYLELEDWVTVARFYGVTPKIVSTHFVQFEQARGFEAVATAADSEGREISAGLKACVLTTNATGAGNRFSCCAQCQNESASKSTPHTLRLDRGARRDCSKQR